MSCEIKYFERSVLHCDFLNFSGAFSVFEKKFAQSIAKKLVPKNFTVFLVKHPMTERIIMMSLIFISSFSESAYNNSNVNRSLLFLHPVLNFWSEVYDKSIDYNVVHHAFELILISMWKNLQNNHNLKNNSQFKLGNLLTTNTAGVGGCIKLICNRLSVCCHSFYLTLKRDFWKQEGWSDWTLILWKT
jgi:hypothetical protein